MSAIFSVTPVAFAAPVLEMEQILANGKSVRFSREHGVTLPAGRYDLEFRFRTKGATPPGWIVRYQLAGQDPTWHAADGEMALIARMLDAQETELSSYRVPVIGQNLSFPNVPTRAGLNRRIEPLVVPARAKFLEIVFDSGRPDLTGEWIIGEVTVNHANQIFGPQDSLWRNPFLKPQNPGDLRVGPQLWERRGDPAMARLEKSTPKPGHTDYFMTLRDRSKTAFAGWISRQPLPGNVKAGEVLTLGWWERSRVGDQRLHSARYSDVPSGELLFRAVGRGVGAVYGGGGINLPVHIRQHVWAQPWFAPAVALLGASAFGLGLWQWLRTRYRRKLARVELEAKVEKDRMRIARDIHDDVGAQLTRLSLMCANAANGAAPGQMAEIAGASRQIAQSMDEIVWAVEPGNDSLDKLCTYLGRFTDEFLEESGVRARYSLPTDPPALPLSAEVRHNLLHAVKEALNNAVKYARAGEIRLSVTANEKAVEITVADDGEGFDEATASAGHGLRNMHARLKEIHGSCSIESSDGAGTRVTFRWPLPCSS